jgi:U1 small nuclear ribonucleoprotein
MPPADHPPHDRRTHAIDGVAQYVNALKERQEETKDDEITLCWLQKRDKEQLEKREKQRYLLEEGFKKDYKPAEDENIRGDAFKTLFVCRLPHDCSTKDIEKEFNRFGPIERVRIVTDRSQGRSKSGKPRGYAFVLFETEEDMKGKTCLPERPNSANVSQLPTRNPRLSS